MFSKNTNKNAVKLLKNNPDKIYWNWLSTNSSAIDFIENNLDKINRRMIFKNSAIFDYDYRYMKKTRHDLLKELMEVMFHPQNIRKWESWGFGEGT